MSAGTNEIPKLVGPDVMAEAFGCPRSQVMRWVEDGKLPSPVVNRHRTKRWHPEDVHKWLDRRRQKVPL